MLKLLILVICVLTFAALSGILSYMMALGVLSAMLMGVVLGSAGALIGSKLTRQIK